LGVDLAPYRGYDPGVKGALANEFATVGYRAHSMIHGEMEPSAPPGTWSPAQLDAFGAEGIQVGGEGNTTLVVRRSVTFGYRALPSYNGLREAYGLPPKTSFTAITGESTASFPSDSEIDPNDPINDPNILDFVELRDADNNVIPLDSEAAQEDAVVGIRRTTL